MKRNHNIKRPTVLIKCEQCGKFAYVRKDGAMKYCSRGCVGKSQNKQKKVLCLECGNLFMARRSDIVNGRGKYCSKICADKAKIGVPSSSSTKFKKGHILNTKGIPKIPLKNRKRVCKKCGVEKNIEDFTVDRECVYEKSYTCKKCTCSMVSYRYHLKPFEERSTRKVPILTHEQRKKNRKLANYKWRLKLTDACVKASIIQKSSLKHKDIPQSLVNLKREEIKTKRLLKELTS